MAYEATPTAARALSAVRRILVRAHSAEASASGPAPLRAAWSVFWTTRAAVLLVAIFAALSFGPAAGGLAERNAATFDEPALTHALVDPAYLIALASFLAALVLLHRLVALELGRPLAGPTLLLLAVFPAALFFGAPYSESLFLLLAPLAMLWWSSREPAPRDAAWLLLAPLGLAAYAAFLGLAEGDAWRFLDVQDAWSRELAVPLAGAWDGFTAAVDGARQLASGQREVVYFEEAAGDPYRIAAINLMLFGALVFAVAACVGCCRRLPTAYGAWVAASLVLPLTFPVKPQPLMSLPRFLAVLFPIFMWLAVWSEERRATARVAAVSALGLGLFTAQFASWHWVS